MGERIQPLSDTLLNFDFFTKDVVVFQISRFFPIEFGNYPDVMIIESDYLEYIKEFLLFYVIKRLVVFYKTLKGKFISLVLIPFRNPNCVSNVSVSQRDVRLL